MIFLKKLTIHYTGDAMSNPSVTYGWTTDELESLLEPWSMFKRTDIKSVHFDDFEVLEDTWRAHLLVMGVT